MSGIVRPRTLIVLAACLALVLTGSVVVLSTAEAATFTPPTLRQRVDLNTGWRFLKADASGAQNPGFNAADGRAPGVGTGTQRQLASQQIRHPDRQRTKREHQRAR